MELTQSNGKISHLSHFILAVRVFEREEESDPKDDGERERHPEHVLPQGKASRSVDPLKESDYGPD